MKNEIWNRRQVLLAGVAGSVACVAGAHARAAVPLLPARGHGLDWVELFNLHTSETLKVKFRNAAGYISSALGRLQHVLADHRTGEQHAMDPKLYGMLADLAVAADREPRFEIISGYRSPLTNQRLREHGGGQAKHSQHMYGRALDIRLEGVPCARLRDLALKMKRGGVGYYARSNFVHIDTARVRYWEG